MRRFLTPSHKQAGVDQLLPAYLLALHKNKITQTSSAHRRAQSYKWTAPLRFGGTHRHGDVTKLAMRATRSCTLSTPWNVTSTLLPDQWAGLTVLPGNRSDRPLAGRERTASHSRP